MGEIAARLRADQDSSRAQFAVTFERFSRRSTKRRTAHPGRRRAVTATSPAGVAL